MRLVSTYPRVNFSRAGVKYEFINLTVIEAKQDLTSKALPG